MKIPNLDYTRLADHLVDSGLIDRATAQHVLQQCVSTGALFPELLVKEGLISDWEISRVCAELFHLPYLPVSSYEPSPTAAEGLDADYLRQYGLVPLDRFGDLLTLSLPGLVPSAVLQNMVTDSNLQVLLVIGTVETNRRWLDEHLAPSEDNTLEAFSAALPDDDSSWGNLFDEADDAVKLELNEFDIDGDLEQVLGADLGELGEVDLGELEVLGDIDLGEVEGLGDIDDLTQGLDQL